MVSSPKFLHVLAVPSCAVPPRGCVVPPRAATLSPEIYYTIVDREEEVGLDEVLGVELVERMREKGFVIKEWVDQNAILGHRSVGGFASHCGWNSLMEAAWNGVPILAWPLGGDRKINAGLVEMSGWGIWNKTWGWTGERVVKVEEIGEAIKEAYCRVEEDLFLTKVN